MDAKMNASREMSEFEVLMVELQAVYPGMTEQQFVKADGDADQGNRVSYRVTRR